MSFSLIKHYLFSGLLALSFVSCYDNVISSIPDYPVYLEMNLTTTYPNFRSPTQYETFEKGDVGLIVSDRVGYGGLLVSIGLDGAYYAYDMACPYEAKQNVRVYPDELGLNAICKGCGSVFDISYGNGTPISGPAKEVLKRYRTSLSGNVLFISR